jgi:hypothetical protein
MHSHPLGIISLGNVGFSNLSEFFSEKKYFNFRKLFYIHLLKYNDNNNAN